MLDKTWHVWQSSARHKSLVSYIHSCGFFVAWLPSKWNKMSTQMYRRWRRKISLKCWNKTKYRMTNVYSCPYWPKAKQIDQKYGQRLTEGAESNRTEGKEWMKKKNGKRIKIQKAFIRRSSTNWTNTDIYVMHWICKIQTAEKRISVVEKETK